MLSRDDQRARSRELESGADSGLSSGPARRFASSEKTGSRYMPGWKPSCPTTVLLTGAKGRGLLRRYGEKMTGLSRAQVTRLIARYQASGTVQAVSYRRHRFAQRFTRADITPVVTGITCFRYTPALHSSHATIRHPGICVPGALLDRCSAIGMHYLSGGLVRRVRMLPGHDRNLHVIRADAVVAHLL
jgi:hypothetical protein